MAFTKQKATRYLASVLWSSFRLYAVNDSRVTVVVSSGSLCFFSIVLIRRGQLIEAAKSVALFLVANCGG